jgi:Zn-dependent peptidase ImmA (M78 family)
MEDEADAFAGAFLLPADEVKPQLRRFDLRQVANMKGHWKVSMAAIAMRADRLRLITEYQKKTFFLEMGKLGYRKREPNEPPREYPRLLKAMVAYHVSKLGYSHADMARMLHLIPAEYEKMYSPQALAEAETRRPTLRLVH